VRVATGSGAFNRTSYPHGRARQPGGSALTANGGHGLIGMRQRATLLGGSLNAERANGEFRVRAHLPFPTAPMPATNHGSVP
jgi:hypothetical protein